MYFVLTWPSSFVIVYLESSTKSWLKTLKVRRLATSAIVSCGYCCVGRWRRGMLRFCCPACPRNWQVGQYYEIAVYYSKSGGRVIAGKLYRLG